MFKCLFTLLIWLLALQLTLADEVLTEEERHLLDQELGLGVVGNFNGPGETEPMALLAPNLREKIFKVSENEEHTKEETHVLIPNSKRKNTRWEYRLNQNESQELSLEANGNLVIMGAIDKSEGVSTRFAPAKLYIQAQMDPGQSAHSQYSLLVYDLENPKDLKHSGSMEVTVTDLGAYEIQVPAGQYEATLIRSVAQGAVGPAKLVDTQYRFFAENIGLVASFEMREVSALMLYQKTSKTSRVLLKPID